MNDQRSREGSCFDGLSPEQQLRLSQVLDDCLDRLDQGLSLDGDKLAAQHPDLAQPLMAYLESLNFLQQAVSGLCDRASIPPEDVRETTPKQLGDFKIIRELGRGGMGVVYEACQESLDRRVALKVLPFAALLDAKQIARFRNEAQAAAQLYHPHIVPVFAVGVEQGVHYYAMQLIEGQPLGRVIADLRQRTGSLEPPQNETPQNETVKELLTDYSDNSPGYFRTVARLGIQAAEALHAAHEIGIVHRDIKPSNLLLDVQGNLWVTDFGLARCRSDTNLTKTGDFVGTVRYMSPEQASCQPHLVDHRTDIYSLGVTLYELVVLRHPVRAEQPAAILRQLDREQPYRLRLWNRNVPIDLENIILKAMAKPRDDRYTSAQQFSDDLRRFLEGKTTIAKRPSVVSRTSKWFRRRKVPAFFLGTLVLIVLALLATTVMLVQQKQQTERMLVQSDESFHQYRLQLALTSNHLAILQDQQGHSQQAQTSLQNAVRIHREILVDRPDDEQTLQGLAAALSNLSFLLAKDSPTQAVEYYHEALRIEQRLVDKYPDKEQYASDLALTHSNLGSLHARQGRPDSAIRAYGHAIEILNRLRSQTSNADVLHDLAITYNNLGMIQDGAGRLGEAEQSFQKALQTLESCTAHNTRTPAGLSRLGGVYSNLGVVLERQEHWPKASACYAKAIELQQTALDRAPQVARFRQLLRKHRENLGRVQGRLERG